MGETSWYTPWNAKLVAFFVPVQNAPYATRFYVHLFDIDCIPFRPPPPDNEIRIGVSPEQSLMRCVENAYD